MDCVRIDRGVDLEIRLEMGRSNNTMTFVKTMGPVSLTRSVFLRLSYHLVAASFWSVNFTNMGTVFLDLA